MNKKVSLLLIGIICLSVVDVSAVRTLANLNPSCPSVDVKEAGNECGRGLAYGGFINNDTEPAYRSCGNSLLPSAERSNQCCSDGYYFLPENAEGVCYDCGSTKCRLCKHSIGGWGSYPSRFKYSTDTNYWSFEYVAIPPSKVSKTSYDCSVFQYADTDYSKTKDGVCRLYKCQPVPLTVCWVKTTNGNTEYRWQDTRPDSSWVADFDLTEDTCGQQGPTYCYYQSGNGSNNRYKRDRAEITDGSWSLVGVVGEPECENDSICKNCDEPAACYLKRSDNKLYWGKYRNQEGYISQNKSRSECNSVVICDPTSTPINGSNVAASKCEDTVNKSYQTKTTCDGDYGRGFYEIVCTTTIKPKFDLGSDGLNNSSKLILYKGQGFGFGINMELTKRCEGTFNKAVWNSVYNEYKNKTGSEEDMARYANVIAKLEDKVDEFNNWNFDAKIKIPKIDLRLLTTPQVYISQMAYEIIDNGVSRKTEESDTLASGKVFKNFVYTNEYKLNESKPKQVRYYPPKVYLDKISGEITTNMENAIDGGNRVYVNMDTDLKENDTFPINISITNLEDDKTITNNHCLIQIAEPTSLYRIIDVNNPFVNNTRAVPKNWVNDSSDYSVIINGKTNSGKARINSYKNSPLYVFNLSRKNLSIAEIKESNKTISSDYLGTCSNADKDTVSQKLCAIINSK